MQPEPHGLTAQTGIRSSRVNSFAVRSDIRALSIGYRSGTLQKYSGIFISAVAWVVFLIGLAYFLLAAMQQQAEELSAGLDSTERGISYCLSAIILLAVAVPQWVMGERRLSRLLTI